jgi:hypothetical protein
VQEYATVALLLAAKASEEYVHKVFHILTFAHALKRLSPSHKDVVDMTRLLRTLQKRERDVLETLEYQLEIKNPSLLIMTLARDAKLPDLAQKADRVVREISLYTTLPTELTSEEVAHTAMVYSAWKSKHAEAHKLAKFVTMPRARLIHALSAIIRLRLFREQKSVPDEDIRREAESMLPIADSSSADPTSSSLPSSSSSSSSSSSAPSSSSSSSAPQGGGAGTKRPMEEDGAGGGGEGEAEAKRGRPDEGAGGGGEA